MTAANVYGLRDVDAQELVVTVMESVVVERSMYLVLGTKR